ncbi:MAG TPA: S-methyl-5-thioribose-1-phosphate isomerase [Nitrospiria bacterium]|nr:S-methyl-5-thioribose-1-phosphate isomerase [Nitrospiria bacterium]
MVPTIEWTDKAVRILDQTKLPHTVVYRDCTDYRMVARAIRELAIRGAPAIGIAAAMGAALGAKSIPARDRAGFLDQFHRICDEIRTSRPTAVNLFWALDRVERAAKDSRAASTDALKEELIALGRQMLDEDIALNRQMGNAGANLIPNNASILTHCNTGSLATGGYGTALGVIRAAVEAGKKVHVYVDETRPVLQGARLTAWELLQDQIPCTLITDNMAGSLMRRGKVDLCIVGADRITANGDTANKIGTYSVAVLAKAHTLPFYVAAPLSTIDFSLASGDLIPIEERDPEEVTSMPTASGRVATAPKGVPVYNPAFDVTPAALITKIITERGAVSPDQLHTLR